MTGQLEQELLYLERQYWQFPDPDALVKRLVALEQGLAQSWASIGFKTTPTTGHTVTIAGCSGSFKLPDSIPYTDSRYGTGTLAWDSSSSSWKRCASGLVSPFNGAVFALHYELTVSGSSLVLAVSWVADAGFHPVASVCADPTNFSSPLTGSAQTCPPPTYSKVFVTNSSIAVSTLYQSNAQTVTIGPVAPV